MKIDQIIRTRRRTIALIVDQQGRLIVRAPLRATRKQIEQFAGQKAAWIKAKQDLAAATSARFAPKKYLDGEDFLYLGKAYRLAIVENSGIPLRLEDRFYLSRSALKQAEQVFMAWYVDQARRLVAERVREYATRLGYPYRQVKISKARTRWGSCSPNGNLNFSWRLAMAPLEVVDYVVIHELVHLREKSHAHRFWAQVEAILPGYAQQVRWLKTNGYRLRLS